MYVFTKQQSIGQVQFESICKRQNKWCSVKLKFDLERVESIVGKGENAGNHNIFKWLLFYNHINPELSGKEFILRHLLFSTGKVHVIDLKLDTRTKSETLRSVTDLGGAIVTCLQWDTSSGKLYIGDDMGKVSMVPVHTNKVGFRYFSLS